MIYSVHIYEDLSYEIQRKRVFFGRQPYLALDTLEQLQYIVDCCLYRSEDEQKDQQQVDNIKTIAQTITDRCTNYDPWTIKILRFIGIICDRLHLSLSQRIDSVISEFLESKRLYNEEIQSLNQSIQNHKFSPPKPDFFDELPLELRHAIIEYLPIKDRLAFSFINKACYEVLFHGIKQYAQQWCHCQRGTNEISYIEDLFEDIRTFRNLLPEDKIAYYDEEHEQIDYDETLDRLSTCSAREVCRLFLQNVFSKALALFLKDCFEKGKISFPKIGDEEELMNLEEDVLSISDIILKEHIDLYDHIALNHPTATYLPEAEEDPTYQLCQAFLTRIETIKKINI